MVLDNHLYRNMNVNMVEFREIGSLVLESRQVKYILTYTAEQVCIFQVIAVRLLRWLKLHWTNSLVFVKV